MTFIFESLPQRRRQLLIPEADKSRFWKFLWLPSIVNIRRTISSVNRHLRESNNIPHSNIIVTLTSTFYGGKGESLTEYYQAFFSHSQYPLTFHTL
jgi:hypothetical protein